MTVDTTTNSATFVDLLTLNITIGNNPLIVKCAGAVSNNNNMNVRLTLDGASEGGSQIRSVAVSNVVIGFSVFAKTVAVAAGSHVVKLQWKSDGSTTMQCRPLTNIDGERAALLVQETSLCSQARISLGRHVVW